MLGLEILFQMLCRLFFKKSILDFEILRCRRIVHESLFTRNVVDFGYLIVDNFLL